MNPRSSLPIWDTKTLLVHRMSARKANRISPILVGTCPLPSSGVGVSIYSSVVWADPVSCFDWQRGTAGRLCDPRASALRPYRFRFTLLEASCLVKSPSSPAGERGLVDREAPEGETMWGEQKAQPLSTRPPPRSLSSRLGSYAVHLCETVLKVPAPTKLPAGCPCDLSWRL